MHNEEILGFESRLRRLTEEVKSSLTNPEAARHLQGFIYRHYMMQTCRLFLEEKFEPSKKQAMSVYEATDCMIHVNSYYVNLRGCLDNLSWIVQYQHGILPGVSESGGKKRQSCYLFSAKFLKLLSGEHPALAGFLLTKEQWSKDFAELRDPAAHRVPIIVSRSVLVGDEAKSKFETIMKSLPEELAAGRPAWQIYGEADAIGSRLPLMFLQQADGKIEHRPLLHQLWDDHLHHIEISTEILKYLL